MLSLADALSFSFCKRSFVLGTILLFFVILFYFGMWMTNSYMEQRGLELSTGVIMKVVFTLYIGQTIGYSILFSYLFIHAKQNIYDLPQKFSDEFFIRVCLTFFGLSVLSSVGLYFVMPYALKFLWNSLMPMTILKAFPWTRFFLEVALPSLVCAILIGYLWSAIYMAYIMHFNFSRFFYKYLKVLAHPLIYLQILFWGFLFILFICLPIWGIFLMFRTFSIQTVLASFANCIMGLHAATELTIFSVVFGVPIAIICLNTKSGRMILFLFTLLYALAYGLFWIMLKQIEKQAGMPFELSLPISAALYLYLFFFLFCLMFVLTSIILPSGLIHLVTQGAFYVHKTFEPNVGEKQIQQPLEVKKDLSPEGDGWLS